MRTAKSPQQAFWFLFALVSLTAAPLAAAPVITSHSGYLMQGETVTISGSNFGSKSPPAPLVWAPFDSGINPSSLGENTSWDGIDNMGWSSDYGGTAKGTAGESPWTLRIDRNYWTSDGQKIYMYKKEKKNFLITDSSQNWKIWRMWAASHTYPNIYAASSNGRVYTEGLGSNNGFWDSFRTGTTDWVTVEHIVQASTFGNNDGSLAIIYDCAEAASGTIMTRDSTGPGYMVMNYVIHGVLANKGSWNPPWSTSNRMWADDVYVDTTWARVMLGDASSWSSCTHRETQIPSAWSPSVITVTANQGSFTDGEAAYLYVVDADGNVNATGYPVTIGEVTFTLSVTNGSGSGEYEEGEVAAISADPPDSGKEFAMWVGDFAYVDDRFQASTTVTMPPADISVTAAYRYVYQLTVNSGTGDGQYPATTVVAIESDPPPTGKIFYEWIGDTPYVSDVEAPGTTVTIPSGDIEVTATYTDIPATYWPGDRNEDFFVGQTDLDIVLDQWGNSGEEITDPRADVNEDGFVGQTDLDYVLDDWGKTGSPP